VKKTLIQLALGLACAAFIAPAFAKLSPPVLTEEAKAKADEAKAKAAEAAKKDAELLGKAQDRVADRYIKEQRAKGVIVKPTAIAAAAPAAAAPPATPPAAPKKK
jgi:hypothetical protein